MSNDVNMGVRYSKDEKKFSQEVLEVGYNVFDNIWYDGNYADDVDPVAIYSQQAFGPSRPRTAGVRFSYKF
jgi:hypothetical protein